LIITPTRAVKAFQTTSIPAEKTCATPLKYLPRGVDRKPAAFVGALRTLGAHPMQNIGQAPLHFRTKIVVSGCDPISEDNEVRVSHCTSVWQSQQGHSSSEGIKTAATDEDAETQRTPR